MAAKRTKAKRKPSPTKARDNRRNVKRKGKSARKRGGGLHVSRDQYNEIFRLFQKGVTPARIGRELDLSHSTVTKYIKSGDPSRGLEPLQERLQKVKAKALEIADYEATRFRASIYTQAQDILADAVQEVRDYLDVARKYKEGHVSRDKDGRIMTVRHRKGRGSKGLDPAQVLTWINAVQKSAATVKDWQAVLGDMVGWGADDDDQEFRGWTVEELEAFARDGDIPDRMLNGE